MEQAGGFKCIGFCEIDRHAAAAYRAIYDTEGEIFYDDVTRIDTAEMPDFDLFVGGFPCQAYPEKKIIPKVTIKKHYKSISSLKYRDNLFGYTQRFTS